LSEPLDASASSFWKGVRVLVTGGAGFIGSNLVMKLVKLGSEVRVADNLSRGNLQNLATVIDRIEFHKVDLTDKKNCISVSKEVDYIFHLASAVGGIHYILNANVENLAPSSLMNINMLEAARVNDVKGFLFTSSACVHTPNGHSLHKFKEEDAYPANPPTTYGWAKILGEIACKSYYKDYGIRCSVIRIFNAYGENENLDPKSSHVIPSLLRRAILYPKEEFVVFGDGTQERGFLYVKDCVEGLLLSIRKASDADPLNLGNDKLVSINELASKILFLTGRDIPVQHDLNGPCGVNRYCADTTKMKSKLGWEPTTSLDVGLQKTCDWAVKKLNHVAS
jgi:nucleoside-diphosphate-sugar epimerase